MTIQAFVHLPCELSFTSSVSYTDPFNQVSMDVVFTDTEGGCIRLPAFWAGGETWKVRFAPAKPGLYRCRTECSDPANAGLHQQQETLQAAPYDGANSLIHGGGLTVMPDGRHLCQADGAPFLWLADTWWMAFCRRLRFPDDFRQLVADRVQKGFNVIQIIAGLYPDMPWYDSRGANEAGFPWTEDFSTINPAYFDMVDLRVAYLVEHGLVPCIVGEWGYFMDFAGMSVLKKHWRYLVARYSAYPVVWCTAGEALMKYYLAESNQDAQSWKQQRQEQWSDLVRFIREIDGHQRLVTIHPTQFGREQVSDPTLIDFEMLQTGHGGYTSLGPTVDMLEQSLNSDPVMPILVSEVNYEGICESAREEIQRFHFWSCLLSGAMGHTYGANGLWQLNTSETPYGPSPHGTSWGDLPWQEAAALPGSGQLGLGKRLLEQLSWWEMLPHPEWISHPASTGDRHQCYIAGVPGVFRVVYYPANCSWLAWQGKLSVQQMEESVTYHCTYINPKTGTQHDLGTTRGSEYVLPKPPIFQDWVLVMRAAGE
ncbi:MAG: DUF4038 domain-containing protein [Anaerolineae bacterium]|nr:DUF4038 domain-containing protein [Anaerolineae bacterium]